MAELPFKLGFRAFGYLLHKDASLKIVFTHVRKADFWTGREGQRFRSIETWKIHKLSMILSVEILHDRIISWLVPRGSDDVTPDNAASDKQSESHHGTGEADQGIEESVDKR